jgi:DNA-binding transcriptional regulator/RsmH inhibitor MraZ
MFSRDIETRDIGAMAEDEIMLDGQGRFVIPQRFREGDPKLGREVVLVGAVDRIEIWRKDDYKKFMVAKRAYAKERREMAEKGVALGAE